MIRINLLPRKVSKKKKGLLQSLVLTVAALVLVLVGIGYFWAHLNGQIKDLKIQISKAQQEKEKLKDVNTQKAAYESNIAKLKDKLDIITQIQERRYMPIRLFDELTKVLDRDTPVWLLQFFFDDERITMDGYSLSNPDLAAFVTKLEKTPFYKNVELLYSTKEKKEDREIFRFSLTAVPQAEDDPASRPAE